MVNRTMKFKQAIPLAVLACALASTASAECMVHIYKVAGTATGKSGRPLSGPIAFSWIEEHDGRMQSKQTRARAGRYSIDIPFYAQAKSKPGAMYTCDAVLKSVSYTFPSVPGQREARVLQLEGVQTTARLSVESTPSSSGR